MGRNPPAAAACSRDVHPDRIRAGASAFSLNSLNADSVMVQGAIHANLEWMYNLLRHCRSGFGQACWYTFSRRTIRPEMVPWGMIGVGAWAVLYAFALLIKPPARIVD